MAPRTRSQSRLDGEDKDPAGSLSKSILSHRRRRKVVKLQEVAKHAKPCGLGSCRRMQGSSLPFEVVATILSRLPVKSLLRFRCVCKEWRTLTYSPSFIKEHHACARALGRVALVPRGASPEMLLYDFDDNEGVRFLTFNVGFGDPNGYMISNPVNGLVCCTEPIMNCNPKRYEEDNHYLLNPATRELARLPTSRNGPMHKCNSPGLLFDSSTGGYKLVKFIHEGPLGQCGCEVLEVGTQEWREVGGAACTVPMTAPVHLNGALHWITWWFPKANSNFTARTIVAFNHKDENFRLIQVPNECTTYHDQVYLVEWEGLLCIVKFPKRCRSGSGCVSATDRRCLVIIWRLEDHATCRWSEAHCSSISNHASSDGELVVVGIRGHEILLVQTRGRGELGLLCAYDLRTTNLRELYCECPSVMLPLTESLVSPRYLAGNPSLQ